MCGRVGGRTSGQSEHSPRLCVGSGLFGNMLDEVQVCVISRQVKMHVIVTMGDEKWSLDPCVKLIVFFPIGNGCPP